jgi:hypothetical protein
VTRDPLAIRDLLAGQGLPTARDLLAGQGLPTAGDLLAGRGCGSGWAAGPDNPPRG